VPIDVDQEQRRRDVAEAAARLVARSGLGAVTFRGLAAELGCSTTAISHYFPNRKAIVIETYRFVVDRALRRRMPPPGADGRTVIASIDPILPLTPEGFDDWVLWFCFWTEALFDPELAAVQRHYSRETGRMIEKMLLGLGCPGAEARGLARKILTALYGIAVQAAFDRETWTPAAQRAALHDVIRPLLPALVLPDGPEAIS
jgi:AcrR family transcriptional regulator